MRVELQIQTPERILLLLLFESTYLFFFKGESCVAHLQHLPAEKFRFQLTAQEDAL